MEGGGLNACSFVPTTAVLWWWVQPDRGIQFPLWRPFCRFLWSRSREMRLTGGFCDSVGFLFAIGTLLLAAFGGGELLDIYIHKLVLIFFLLFMACPYLCNDDIKYEHAHNSHTRG